MKGLFAIIIACVLSLSSIFSLKAQVNPDTTYWWNDAVFYEAFVRSFYDTNGDGIGDFNGLTAKLGYLDSLGVTAIWLMPVCPSPSYHGYDITDYKAVNPQYGTIQEYQNFVAAAHNKGIKVFFDAVMNHTSNEHPWFLHAGGYNNKYHDYYRFTTTNPGYNGPWGEQVWDPYQSGSNDTLYYGVFSYTMPDLNYVNPVVFDTMMTVVDFWLDSMHVDGFRCDGAPYIFEEGKYLQNCPETLNFWAQFHTRSRADNPQVMSVGEVWLSDDTILEYTGNGKFDICFEFNLASDILNAVSGSNASTLISNFQWRYDNFPFAQWGTFLSNHDQNRSFDVLGDNVSKAKVAAGIYLTLPGVPFVYYGEEVGMVGSDNNNYLERSPMQWNSGKNAGFTTGTPWEAVNTNYTTYNVSTEAANPSSLYNWYKQLIALRNSNAILRRGTYHIATSSQSPVWSYVRSYQGQNLLVVINTGGTNYTNQNLDLSGSGIADGGKTLSDLLSNNTVTAAVSGGVLDGISIAANSVSVYQLTDYTGTSDVTVNDNVTVYPNPVDNNLYINFNNTTTTGKYFVSITDIEGRQVKAMELTQDQLSQPQDVSNLPTGVYILHLSNGSLNQYFKIVKM